MVKKKIQWFSIQCTGVRAIIQCLLCFYWANNQFVSGIMTPRIWLQSSNLSITLSILPILKWENSETCESLCRQAWLFNSGLKQSTLMLAYLRQSAEKYFKSTNLAFHQQLSLGETCTNRNAQHSQNHGSGDEGFICCITLQLDRGLRIPNNVALNCSEFYPLKCHDELKPMQSIMIYETKIIWNMNLTNEVIDRFLFLFWSFWYVWSGHEEIGLKLQLLLQIAA